MKKILQVSILFHLFCTQFCYSQSNQKELKPSVILKKGDSIPISFFTENNYKKKKNIFIAKHFNFNTKEKINQEIPVDEIDKIYFPINLKYSREKNAEFNFDTHRFINLKKGKKILIEVIKGDYCSLYLENKTESYLFYVQKNNADYASIIHGMNGTDKKIGKAGVKFFSDSPELIQMIKKDDNKNRFDNILNQLTKYVDFYNKSKSK